jgi:hypothetical protein
MTLEEKEIIHTLSIAIKGRNLIRIKYDGEYRIVEPYLIGELYDKFQNHLIEGVYALRAWFVSGYSSQNLDIKEGDGWRIYHLQKIEKLEILVETNLKIRPFYDKYDKNFKRINFHVFNNN